MKKVWTLIITFSLLLVVFTPFAEAKRVPTPAPMPNLYSKSIANSIKAGKYKYYGVKLNNTYATVKKQWGIPSKRSYSKKYSMSFGNYYYGKSQDLYLVTEKGGNVKENNLLVHQIIISKNNPTKFEYNKVMKAFGKASSISKGSTTRIVSYETNNAYTSLMFEKAGSKFYLKSLSYGRSGSSVIY